MKTAKSPAVAVVVSPSQKKLKQARLPFKLLSDVLPKPEAPATRKRKLSAPESEVASKVGKLSKENELDQVPVVISDDDSQDAPQTDSSEKQLNPFVKLVDTAWKKKQQKGKTSKRRKNSKSKNKLQTSVELSADEVSDKNQEESEVMDVDEVEETTPALDQSKLVTKDEVEATEKLIKTSNKSPEAVKDRNQNKVDPKSQNSPSKPDVSIVLDDDSNSITEIMQKNDSNTQHQESNLNENSEILKSEDVSQTENTEIQEFDHNTSEILPVTPKRTRSITKKINSDNKSATESTSSQLNESALSNPTTPKQNKNGDALNTSLTPKQLQRKLESAKKKELKEKEKQEREEKRLQEKEERDKAKKEKEDQKKREREEKEEAKKKEREEKEEAKKKEKEEKDKLRELEKKVKEEREEMKKKEREEKEEARKKDKEAREEERRKKQEAADLEKQELELKKKKAAEAFVNFFVPKQKIDKENFNSNPVSKNDMLSSFAIKSDMRLAPTIRSNLTDNRRERLDELMKSQKNKDLYVKLLKMGHKPESSGKTWPLSERDDDVLIVEDELPLDGAGEELTCESAARERQRPKLLSFHDNRRPPYWGTWRKKSPFVKPRRPFGQDQKLLDYTCDSDDDWEEEAEGESLDGSAAGSDAEPEDDYEVDNEVFVPHGYLSDEEATMDDDGEDMLSLSPEAQKARLKNLEDEFETELKKPTEKLKPRLYGPIWETAEGGKPEKCVDALWNYFGKLTMIMGDITPLLQPAPATEETEKKKNRKKKLESEDSPKSDKKKSKTSKEPRKKAEPKKNTPDVKKNQLGINSFLKKINS